jgi:hypothetical protein
MQIEKRLEDGALARAIGAKEQRQRREIDPLSRRTDAFEVLNL